MIQFYPSKFVLITDILDTFGAFSSLISLISLKKTKKTRRIFWLWHHYFVCRQAGVRQNLDHVFWPKTSTRYGYARFPSSSVFFFSSSLWGITYFIPPPPRRVHSWWCEWHSQRDVPQLVLQDRLHQGASAQTVSLWPPAYPPPPPPTACFDQVLCRGRKKHLFYVTMVSIFVQAWIFDLCKQIRRGRHSQVQPLPQQVVCLYQSFGLSSLKTRRWICIISLKFLLIYFILFYHPQRHSRNTSTVDSYDQGDRRPSGGRVHPSLPLQGENINIFQIQVSLQNSTVTFGWGLKM